LLTFFELLLAVRDRIGGLAISKTYACTFVPRGSYVHLLILFTFGYWLGVRQIFCVNGIGSGCTRTPSLGR
jgi:hypothetical protein